MCVCICVYEVGQKCEIPSGPSVAWPPGLPNPPASQPTCLCRWGLVGGLEGGEFCSTGLLCHSGRRQRFRWRFFFLFPRGVAVSGELE